MQQQQSPHFVQIGGLVTVSGAGGGKQVVVGGGVAKAGTLSKQLPAGTVQGQLLLHGDKFGQVCIQALEGNVLLKWFAVLASLKIYCSSKIS